jgi:23S rRNA (adenine1618-N6)-methyltransferase
MSEKKEFPAIKNNLHPRNPHRGRYDFPALITSCPDLAPFVAPNAYGDESVDFADPAAVKALNRALLSHFYGIKEWGLPEGYLCPPIPGRADYIHTMADLLATSNKGVVPRGAAVQVLDIGVGANAIYPMLGKVAYDWQFVGSDNDDLALDNAYEIFERNEVLKDGLVCRYQADAENIFEGLIQPADLFEFTMCNPPFHSSAADAAGGTRRKLRSLGTGHAKGKGLPPPVLNFGGQSNELWCEGGEMRFVRTMISQSRPFKQQCLWFSTLVSKQDNLPLVYQALERIGAIQVKTLDMAQGNKISRVVAWSFMTDAEQKLWAKSRWRAR